MKVLIAGCGYVGSRVAELLVQQGAEVWGVTRRKQVLPAGVTAVQADLTDPSTFAPFPETITHIVYAAAAVDRSERAYNDAYVVGVKNIARWAAHRSIARFLFTSSTGVYHHEAGEWVDESSKIAPVNFTGRTVLEGERVVCGEVAHPVVLRFGGIYGPGRCYAVDRVRCGVAVMPHEVMHFTNRIHREDCAHAVVHLLNHPAPEQLYLGVDSAPVTLSEVTEFIATSLNITLPRMAGENPITGKRCSNKRLLESGYRFIYPTYREGYQALLEGKHP